MRLTEDLNQKSFQKNPRNFFLNFLFLREVFGVAKWVLLSQGGNVVLFVSLRIFLAL